MVVFDLIVLAIYWLALAIVFIHVWTRKTSNLHLEVLPFAWVSALVIAAILLFYRAPLAILESDTVGTVLYLIFAPLYCLYARAAYKEWKNSDDDRWKKRRKKLKAKVKEVAGKLVVEPEPELVRVTA